MGGRLRGARSLTLRVGSLGSLAVTSTVVYSVGASEFDAGKLTAILWLVGVLSKFKDSGFDVSTLTDGPVEKVITILATVMAFA